MNWASLHTHTHLSLLDGLSKPTQIADRCSELNYTSCAITDHGTLSGVIAFSEAMKKKNIKPILGNEFYIKDESYEKYAHQVILAKNINGWKNLIKLTSISNHPSLFYFKPRIEFNHIAEINNGDLISFSGHPGSTLAQLITQSNTHEKLQRGIDFVNKMIDIFGRENFRIEVQRIDTKHIEYVNELSDILREISKKTNVKCIATGDAHYATKNQSEDHRLILCSSINSTLRKIETARRANIKTGLDAFFDIDNFHIPSPEELISYGNTEEEIENAYEVSELCEQFDINSQPKLPKFTKTEGMTEADYLRHLCVLGWKLKYKPDWDKEIYANRVKEELKVLNDANLAGYFLIVQDIVKYAKDNNWLVGPGRGSGAGCLVSYLLNITSIDSIKYGLLFERFYNAGRNSPGNISLPDIDLDFPIEKRAAVIEYIKNEYGSDRVCQIATYGRLMGSGAIREVLRIHEACSAMEINIISKNFPNEAEIADELEESDHHSIITWTLENRPKLISEWCQLNDDGTLSGPYSKYFEQAIRLEGTYKSRGKHAAGIIISPEPLENICPMIYDKNTGEKIAEFNKDEVEKIGLLKLDILGVATLDKLMGVNNLLEFGRINI